MSFSREALKSCKECQKAVSELTLSLIYQSKDMHNNSKRLYSAGYWDEQPELQSHTVIIISLRTA